jgi:hypothetical protein
VDATNSKPVAGALVLAIRNGLPPLSKSATTSAAGAFDFTGLTAGTYRICVQTTSGFLDPCYWQVQGPTVTITSGQSSTGNTIKLTAGSVLAVRLNDPLGVLSGTTTTAPPPVALTVTNTLGFPVPLTMTSKDATGSNHQVTIPFDAAISLQVSSSTLNLKQADGTAVAGAGATVGVTHSSTSSVAAPQVVFQVSGLKP